MAAPPDSSDTYDACFRAVRANRPLPDRGTGYLGLVERDRAARVATDAALLAALVALLNDPESRATLLFVAGPDDLGDRARQLATDAVRAGVQL